MEKLASTGIPLISSALSVCSPSRASIISGQNATRHHTTTWINPSVNNQGEFGPEGWTGLALSLVHRYSKVFKDAGYRTIHIGKAHFGNKQAPANDPTTIGFDYNVGGACWGVQKLFLWRYTVIIPSTKKQEAVTHDIPHLEKYYDSGTFLTEALTLETIDLIKKSVADDKPFFLHMSHYALHAPFDADPRFINNYDNKLGKRAAFGALTEGMDKSLGASWTLSMNSIFLKILSLFSSVTMVQMLPLAGFTKLPVQTSRQKKHSLRRRHAPSLLPGKTKFRQWNSKETSHSGQFNSNTTGHNHGHCIHPSWAC